VRVLFVLLDRYWLLVLIEHAKFPPSRIAHRKLVLAYGAIATANYA